nr:hypothetical protein [Tanacetum cinerariifolium]
GMVAVAVAEVGGGERISVACMMFGSEVSGGGGGGGDVEVGVGVEVLRVFVERDGGSLSELAVVKSDEIPATW